MSVYRPAKSRFYHYDLVIQGRRYHGSTGQETIRGAESFERRIRREIADGTHGEAGALTLDEAAGRWWREEGESKRSAVHIERRIEIVLRLMGPRIRICDIGTKEVSAAVERRRRETFTKSAKPGAKRYPVSNATVNQDIVRTLRPILNRARTTWEAKGLKVIDWDRLMLAEPEPPIIWYSAAERAAWLAECDDTARLALDCLLTYGWRFGELFFPPSAYDAHGAEDAEGRSLGPHVVINDRKAGPLLTPLRQDHARELGARAGRARAAKLETVWVELDEAGRLTPVTYHGLYARLRSAAKRAGLSAPRLIHGTRHHAGSAILSRSGSLKLTQQALGHADIKSTQRYAHALMGDLRTALGADLPRNSPEPAEPADAVTLPKSRRSKG